MKKNSNKVSSNQNSLTQRWVEAALFCDVKELKTCLKLGQDPNVSFPWSSLEEVTALMVTSMKGDQACFDLLFPVSNARLRDKSGADALIYAVQGRFVRHPILDQLLTVADPLVRTDSGMSALWCAVSRTEDVKAVEKLLSFNDPYENHNHGSMSLLGVALAQGKLLMSQTLVKHLRISRIQQNIEGLLEINKASPSWAPFVQDVKNQLKAEREQELLQESLLDVETHLVMHPERTTEVVRKKAL